MPGLNNFVPPNYETPPFPSLYWLIGPPGVVKPTYLYRISDVWRFTLFWTLIVFEAAHLAVGAYAVGIVWWGGRHQRSGIGMGRKKNLASAAEDANDHGQRPTTYQPRGKVQAGVRNSGISGMWAVPVVYGIIGGVEGVFAGSAVGLLYASIRDNSTLGREILMF